jgi:hypothetical protein
MASTVPRALTSLFGRMTAILIVFAPEGCASEVVLSEAHDDHKAPGRG